MADEYTKHDFTKDVLPDYITPETKAKIISGRQKVAEFAQQFNMDDPGHAGLQHFVMAIYEAYICARAISEQAGVEPPEDWLRFISNKEDSLNRQTAALIAAKVFGDLVQKVTADEKSN